MLNKRLGITAGIWEGLQGGDIKLGTSSIQMTLKLWVYERSLPGMKGAWATSALGWGGVRRLMNWRMRTMCQEHSWGLVGRSTHHSSLLRRWTTEATDTATVEDCWCFLWEIPSRKQSCQGDCGSGAKKLRFQPKIQCVTISQDRDTVRWCYVSIIYKTRQGSVRMNRTEKLTMLMAFWDGVSD